MGMTFEDLSPEELCDLMCGDPEEDDDDSKIYGNTSKCDKFLKIKPISVLKKGKCPVKEAE